MCIYLLLCATKSLPSFGNPNKLFEAYQMFQEWLIIATCLWVSIVEWEFKQLNSTLALYPIYHNVSLYSGTMTYECLYSRTFRVTNSSICKILLRLANGASTYEWKISPALFWPRFILGQKKKKRKKIP